MSPMYPLRSTVSDHLVVPSFQLSAAGSSGLLRHGGRGAENAGQEIVAYFSGIVILYK